MTSNGKSWPLLVSVGLNLVFVGLLAGVVLNLSTTDRSARPHAVGSERSELTGESREAVRQALRSARETSALARDSHKRAREALHGTLTATRFDPDAARIAFTALRETETAMQRSMQDSLLEKMATMSQDERTRLAERLDRRRGRSRRRSRP